MELVTIATAIVPGIGIGVEIPDAFRVTDGPEYANDARMRLRHAVMDGKVIEWVNNDATRVMVNLSAVAVVTFR